MERGPGGVQQWLELPARGLHHCRTREGFVFHPCPAPHRIMSRDFRSLSMFTAPQVPDFKQNSVPQVATSPRGSLSVLLLFVFSIFRQIPWVSLFILFSRLRISIIIGSFLFFIFAYTVLHLAFETTKQFMFHLPSPPTPFFNLYLHFLHLYPYTSYCFLLLC